MPSEQPVDDLPLLEHPLDAPIKKAARAYADQYAYFGVQWAIRIAAFEAGADFALSNVPTGNEPDADLTHPLE